MWQTEKKSFVWLKGRLGPPAEKGQEKHVLLVPVGPQSCLLHAGVAAAVKFEGTSALCVKNACIFQPEHKNVA